MQVTTFTVEVPTKIQIAVGDGMISGTGPGISVVGSYRPAANGGFDYRADFTVQAGGFMADTAIEGGWSPDLDRVAAQVEKQVRFTLHLAAEGVVD